MDLYPLPKHLDALAHHPALPEDGTYLVRFEDNDREDVTFANTGAKQAALRYYNKSSLQWNAHLFAKIDSNCSDVQSPSANLTGSPWQPLEAAPTDGTWVWCMDPQTIHPYIARFISYDYSDLPYQVRPAQSYTGWIDERSDAVTPTVWMPIPPSPFTTA